MPIVVEKALKPLLFCHHHVVDRLCSVSGGLADSLPDLFMVPFVPPLERGHDIDGRRLVVETVQHPSFSQAKGCLHLVVPDHGLVVTVEIDVLDISFDEGFLWIEQLRRLDEMTPDRPPQVRQVQAAEDPVPVAVVGLCHVDVPFASGFIFAAFERRIILLCMSLLSLYFTRKCL